MQRSLLLRWAAAVLPWAAAGVRGQAIGSISPEMDLAAVPACAIACVSNALAVSGCGLDDIAPCTCTNPVYLQRVTACTQVSCEWQEQQKLSAIAEAMCKPYPHPSRRGEVKLVVIILSSLTFGIVALRLLSRLIILGRLELDDWSTLATTIVLAATAGCVLKSVELGFGLHFWNVEPSNAPRIVKIYYAVQMLYVVILIMAKISILALYRRIFPDRNFQRLLKLVFIFLVAHATIFVFVIMFECVPVAGIWDRTLAPKCINLGAVATASAILSIVEDLLILAMPLRDLVKLQLDKKQKIAVIIMFSLGSLACITSMVRLKWIFVFAVTFDATWDAVDAVTWSVAEVSTAIMCGSLPALRPLFKKIPGLFNTTREQTAEFNETVQTDDRGSVSGYKPFRWEDHMPHHLASPYPTSPEPTIEMVYIHFDSDEEARMKPLPLATMGSSPLESQPPRADAKGRRASTQSSHGSVR